MQTTKSPEQVRDCLVEVAPHLMVASPNRDGWIIARTDAPAIAQWVEVRAVDGETHVSVFGNRGIRLDAERCVHLNDTSR
jgi:hypothetical protein